jgi:predicted PurR-regulated permease PerM
VPLTSPAAPRLNPETAPSRFIPVIALVLSVAGLYFAKEVLIPFALAVLLAFLLSPVVRGLERCRLGRVPSVGIVLILSLSAAIGIGWIVSNQLISVVGQLPGYRENIQDKLTALQGPAGGALRKATDSVRELNQDLSAAPSSPPALPPGKASTRLPAATSAHPVPVELVDRPPSALQSLSNMLGPLAAPFGTALIVVVFTTFMLMKREDLRNRLIGLVARRQLNTVTQLLDDAAQRVSRYLLMQFSINAAFGCLIAIGLYFIGVPNALLWGVLAGMLRFVPYIGPLVGGSLPFLLALVVFSGWTRPLLTLGFFVLVELITSNAIEPCAGGARTGISPLAILVAAVFWGALWGPAGLILSMPLTVCLVVLGRYVPQLEFLHVLLGDEPVLSPKAHFYQRLLALDQQEAQSVVELFLKDKTLIEVHDLVIIPALRMAEQDRHQGVLDDAKALFIIQSIGEIIGLIAEYDGDSTIAKRSNETSPRVICLPATDEADGIAAAMLSQVLERAGFPVICLPVTDSVADAVTAVAGILPEPGDLVCVSALPPFALLKARTLSKQLHARFPELKIIVGLWNFSGSESAAERFGKALVHTVVTTLADALAEIQAFADSIGQARETASQFTGSDRTTRTADASSERTSVWTGP